MSQTPYEAYNIYVVDEKANVGVLYGENFMRFKVYLKADTFNWRACMDAGFKILTIAMDDLEWDSLEEYFAFVERFASGSDPDVVRELTQRVKKLFN